MIIDIHTHIWGQHIESDKKGLIASAERYGIDKIYVSGIKSLISDEEEIRFMNDEVYKFMCEQPDLIGGAVYVNPMHANVMDVIRQACEDRGFDMIKLWCNTYADVPEVDPIMEYAAENGIPVLLHAFHKATGQLDNETTGVHTANIARRHPKTKILMAHFGGNCYHGIPAIRDIPNVWCDFCGSIFAGEAVNYAAEYIGAERILFGSDGPGCFHINVGQVKGADLTDEEKEMIFSKNALKLLDRNFKL